MIHDTWEDAIDESIERNTIARCRNNSNNDFSLMMVCDEWAYSDAEKEYWGADEDGHEWRVHMPRRP